MPRSSEFGVRTSQPEQPCGLSSSCASVKPAQPWVGVGAFYPARLGSLSARDGPAQDANFKLLSRHLGGLGYVLKFDFPDCCMLEVGGSARPPMQEAAVLCCRSGGHAHTCDLIEFECQRQIHLLLGLSFFQVGAPA